MKFYLDIFKFSFLEEFAYPVEILAFTIRKLINLGFLILFWFVISSSNPKLFTFEHIVAYFLVSEAIQDLTFTTGGRFGRDIQKMIKSGTLSNYLVKPVNILRFLYASFIGGRTSVTIYAVITLFLGIFLYPPKEPMTLLLFPISLLFTAIAGAGINIFLGIVGFYSPEAGSIKNVYEHVSKILSGALVPLSYFPAVIKNIATFTPFPVLSYFPTSILQEGQVNHDTFLKLGLSAFWAVVLLVTSNIAWKRALRNYDGVGI